MNAKRKLFILRSMGLVADVPLATHAQLQPVESSIHPP